MADAFDPVRLARRDLRRLVGEMWTDERCDGLAPAVLDAAVAENAKSLDRAVLTAYLRHFPTGHAAFDRLRSASQLSAERREWPWRARGRDWGLWDHQDGPDRLARALLDRPDPAAVLREVGLDGDLAQGEFVADALEAACEQAADATGAQAVERGEKLIALFERMAITGKDALLAWALLAPWARAKPPKDHERCIARLLSDRIGDPRLAQSRWIAAEAELAERDIVLPFSLAAILRRWLTEATVRAFFTIVRQTTDRKDQWDAREAFWLGYLDHGAIAEAWFAFGRRAEQQAGRLAREEDVRFGSVSGGADPSHSALLMTIGDMRVTEWSHNGACRFWPNYLAVGGDRSTRARPVPQLYQDSYDGTRLRTTVGPKGFEYLSHVPVQGWQRKFAGVIHRHTGVLHPIWGSG